MNIEDEVDVMNCDDPEVITPVIVPAEQQRFNRMMSVVNARVITMTNGKSIAQGWRPGNRETMHNKFNS